MNNMNVFPCTFLSIIGQGAFGVVYKAETPSKMLVAVKEVQVDAHKKELIEREIEVMAKLNHPNIVRYLGSMYKDSKYYIATEYCPGGDLEGYLKSVGKVNKQIVLYWFKQLVSALSYLQENHYMHRDIKPANLYLNCIDPGRADIKLGDFGFSKGLVNDFTSSKLGTPLYMAPELLSEHSYDYRADVWSLGCVVYELIEGVPMYNASSIRQLIEMQRHSPLFSDKFTQQEKEFILYLVRYGVSDRPNFLHLENSYFIQGIQKPVLRVEHIVKQVDNSPVLNLMNKDLDDMINVLKTFEDVIKENQENTYFFVAYLEFKCSLILKKLASLKPQHSETDQKEKEFSNLNNKLIILQQWVEKHKKLLPVAFEDYKVNSGSLAEFTNLLIPKSYEYEEFEIQLLLIDVCKYFDPTNELVLERLTYLQTRLAN